MMPKKVTSIRCDIISVVCKDTAIGMKLCQYYAKIKQYGDINSVGCEYQLSLCVDKIKLLSKFDRVCVLFAHIFFVPDSHSSSQ